VRARTHVTMYSCQKEGTQIQWIYWGCNRFIVLLCLWPSGLGQRPLFIVGLAFSHSVAEPHHRVAEAPLVWLRHFRHSHGFGHGWNHTLSDMACASMVLASTFVAMATKPGFLAMARNHPHSDRVLRGQAVYRHHRYTYNLGRTLVLRASNTLFTEYRLLIVSHFMASHRVY
jgi:hypothetical protein